MPSLSWYTDPTSHRYAILTLHPATEAFQHPTHPLRTVTHIQISAPYTSPTPPYAVEEPASFHFQGQDRLRHQAFADYPTSHISQLNTAFRNAPHLKGIVLQIMSAYIADPTSHHQPPPSLTPQPAAAAKAGRRAGKGHWL